MATKNHGTPMTPSGKGATKGPMLVAGAALLIPAILLSAALGGQARSMAQEAGKVIDLPGKDRALSPMVEEVFKVGALQGEDWEMFGRISSVAFDPEGNLYVLDGQAIRIVVLGPDGTFLRTIGREGEGPGEFTEPFDFTALTDGSIAVNDLNEGLIFFNPAGEEYHRIARAAGTGPPSRLVLRKILSHPRGGCVALVRSLGTSIGADGKISPKWDDEGTPLVAFYPAAKGDVPEILHRAWSPPVPDPVVTTGRLPDGSETRGYSADPGKKIFDPEQYLGVLPDGRMVLSDSSAYTIKILSPEGKVVRRLRRPLKPTPVTKEIQEKEKLRRVKELLESLTLSPEVRKKTEERLLRQWASLRFADAIRIVTGLAVDWEGRIWVERAGKDVGEEGPIDLITADGKYLGTVSPKGVRIPDAFGPGGLMAYITKTDDLDVPMVVVKRVKGVGR